MKLFECQQCGQLLDFGNTHCERCGRVLGYLPWLTTLSALEPVDGQRWRALAVPGHFLRFCGNAVHEVCNWLVPDAAPSGALCEACRLNRTIPDLGTGRNLLLWQRLEAAKHRLVYGLLRLGLPVASKLDEPEQGLAFDFLSETGPWAEQAERVLTGHAAGVITINIAEADDAERERQRQEMSEPFRTLLGHFRHEAGHYYWERLVRHGPWLERVRALFGDDEHDYASSLDAHYAWGPPPDWHERFVSAYASMHPLEDWAETWAHYLHMVDTLETAHHLGMGTRLRVGQSPWLNVENIADPYQQTNFDTLIGEWIALTFAANSLNRSMGQPDLYPFVLRRPVIDKLRLVHELVRSLRPG